MDAGVERRGRGIPDTSSGAEDEAGTEAGVDCQGRDFFERATAKGGWFNNARWNRCWAVESSFSSAARLM